MSSNNSIDVRPSSRSTSLACGSFVGNRTFDVALLSIEKNAVQHIQIAKAAWLVAVRDSCRDVSTYQHRSPPATVDNAPLGQWTRCSVTEHSALITTTSISTHRRALGATPAPQLYRARNTCAARGAPSRGHLKPFHRLAFLRGERPTHTISPARVLATRAQPALTPPPLLAAAS